MSIEMKVAAIAEDEIFKTPIVILKALDSKDCLPIWVGPFEGQAIEYGIKGNQLPRPLPYDLLGRQAASDGIEALFKKAAPEILSGLFGGVFQNIVDHLKQYNTNW